MCKMQVLITYALNRILPEIQSKSYVLVTFQESMVNLINFIDVFYRVFTFSSIFPHDVQQNKKNRFLVYFFDIASGL